MIALGVGNPREEVTSVHPGPGQGGSTVVINISTLSFQPGYDSDTTAAHALVTRTREWGGGAFTGEHPARIRPQSDNPLQC